MFKIHWGNLSKMSKMDHLPVLPSQLCFKYFWCLHCPLGLLQYSPMWPHQCNVSPRQHNRKDDELQLHDTTIVSRIRNKEPYIWILPIHPFRFCFLWVCLEHTICHQHCGTELEEGEEIISRPSSMGLGCPSRRLELRCESPRGRSTYRDIGAIEG